MINEHEKYLPESSEESCGRYGYDSRIGNPSNFGGLSEFGTNSNLRAFLEFMGEADAMRKAAQFVRDRACAELRTNKWVKMAAQRQEQLFNHRRRDLAQSDNSPQKENYLGPKENFQLGQGNNK